MMITVGAAFDFGMYAWQPVDQIRTGTIPLLLPSL